VFSEYQISSSWQRFTDGTVFAVVSSVAACRIASAFQTLLQQLLVRVPYCGYADTERTAVGTDSGSCCLYDAYVRWHIA